MKFAYINRRSWKFENSKEIRVNIGEYIQFFAVYHLLKYMGIEDDNIIELSEGELENYDGDEAVLIVTNLSKIRNISPKLHIVCIGYHNWGYEISDPEEIKSLTGLDIVGCRDENCYLQLQELNINSYINGCLSITLPKKNEKTGDRVYIVDAPYEVLRLIPEDILKRAKVKTHEYYYNADSYLTESEIRERVVEQYREYYENAGLVITSRLHLAAPCIAWGIPVILVRKTPFITFSWIDKFIPIYTPDQFDNIEWNPEAVDIENIKKIMLRDMSYRIMKKYYEYENILETHKIFSDRDFKPKAGYYKMLIEGLKQYIDNRFSKYERFEYIVWGITANAELLWDYISKNYINAKCRYAVDTYKEITFHGMQAVKPEEADYKDAYVFVIPTGAVQAARTFLMDKEYIDCYFVTETFITEGDIEELINEK